MLPYPTGPATLSLKSSSWLSKAGFLVFILALGIALETLPLKLAGLTLAGSTVLLLSLRYPKLGLYLLILAIPFNALLQVNVGGINIGPTEALVALIMISWLLQMMARRAIIIPHPPMLWPFLLFLWIIGLSWPMTFSLSASLVETLKWVEMLAIYLFIAANFSGRDSRYLIIALLSSGLIQAGLGLYQFVFKVGPAGFLLFDERFLRAYGTFRQPNPYAGYLGLVLPLALAIALWAVGQFRKKTAADAIFWMALTGITFGAGVAALFASQSRGGWLGFAGAILVVMLLKGGKWAVAATVGLIIGAILISMGALTLLPATITERFADIAPFISLPDVAAIPVTNANFAAVERLAHWQAARTMWRDHLWLGVGFGNYEAVYASYAVGRWLDPLGHAHNYILNIGAEAGLAGVLGYFIFWMWITALTLKSIKQMPPDTLQRAVIIGSLGIFAHLHIHNLFDNLYVQGMYLHLAIIFGLITSFSSGRIYSE